MNEAGYANLHEARQRAPTSTPPTTEPPHVTHRRSSTRCATGLIALTGGPDGPIDRALRDGQNDARRARLAAAAGASSATGSTSSCSGTACRQEIAAEPQLLDLAYAHDAAARRHQRGLLRHARRLRGARRAALHRRGQLRRRGQPAPADARALFQVAPTRWRSCSPTCPRRSTTRSRSPSAAPSGRAGASRSCRASSPATMARATRTSSPPRRPSCSGRPRQGLRARLAAAPLADGLHARGLREAPRLRARRHRADEVSRLLPDRRRLHQVGEGERHSGGPGPRLGRRLGRRLGAHHHRSRSAAVRAAVRALPQSRARVDAGLRHRLLPGAARRGDPLRAGASTATTAWRRSSRTASCRRAPCCATSAACCRCRTARSTGCASWCRTIRPIP